MMNSPNFDGSGDSDFWDGKGELEWTERNWKQFLSDADAEVGKFIKIYQSLKDDPDRLDHTALGMGWESEAWSVELDSEEESRSEWFFESSEDEEEYEDSDEVEPYTIHKHPLYVTSRSLHLLMAHFWRLIAFESGKRMEGLEGFELSESLRASETNAIMGIHALEMGDYNLVIVHLQRALTALNRALGCFSEFKQSNRVAIADSVAEEFQAFFFDQREVWLRVIRECRSMFDPR